MEIRVVDAADTLELRRRVLRPGLPAGESMPGDDAGGVVHLAAVDDDGTLLGACLVFPEPCDWRPGTSAWRLRSMAVAPHAHAQGVGRTLLTGVAETVVSRGGTLLWCHARETAAGFYARQGWSTRDQPPVVYDDPGTGLPHRDMHRVL